MKTIFALFLCLGTSVSAQVFLDFENRQPFGDVSEVDTVHVFVKKHDGTQFVGVGYYFDITNEHHAELEKCISLALRDIALSQINSSGRYQTRFACVGRQSLLLQETVAEFDVDESLRIPDHAIKIAPLRLPSGHFRVPGVKRARIRASFEGGSEIEDVYDSDDDHISLRVRSDVVQFGEGLVEQVRVMVTTDFLQDAHIRFDYSDGLTREFDLFGEQIDIDLLNPFDHSLSIASDGSGRIIKIIGAPNTIYEVLESPCPAQFDWGLWRRLETNNEGVASVLDNRALDHCYFKLR